jgi:hypothetical protein
MRYTAKLELLKLVCLPLELVQVLPAIIAALISRFINKKIDVGIGPDPLINNIFHKKAILNEGYSCETFCYSTYYITKDFDFIFTKKSKLSIILAIFLRWPYLFCIFRYKVMFFYFNGGVLNPYSYILWRFEPFLYYLAGIETVLLAYGGDIQDLTRTSNYLFRHAVSKDYPNHKYRIQKIRKKIDLWTQRSSHVIAGCDWIEYLYHWDSVLISHFCIDEKIIPPIEKCNSSGPFIVLHAPNHRTIKGTQYIEKAITCLKAQGLNIELKIIEKVSNEDILRQISEADLVIDQLIIGWYAMFAIEAMSLRKPVICNLRKDFLEFYTQIGLLDTKDCPIINASPSNIETKIKSLYYNREKLSEIGSRGTAYVHKYHSINYIGSHFKKVLCSLGHKPLEYS